MKNNTVLLQTSNLLIALLFLFSILFYTVLSCKKGDPKEEEEKEVIETRGIVAASASDFLSQMIKNYVEKKELNNFVASSVDYNQFKSFLSQIFACPIILEPSSMPNETYQLHFETTRNLQTNQFCFSLVSVGQSGSGFVTCSPRGTVVVECNSKSGKYYVIEYKLR